MYSNQTEIFDALKKMLEEKVEHDEILKYWKENEVNIKMSLLQMDYTNCTMCTEHTTCHYPNGRITSSVMIVMEQYNRDGLVQLLNLLKKLEEKLSPVWVRENIYLTYLLKCEHNSVELKDIAHCKKYFQEEIKLVKPKIIICLGEEVCKAIMGPRFNLETDQFKVYEIYEKDVLGIGTHAINDLETLDQTVAMSHKKDIFNTFKQVNNLAQFE